MAHCPAAVESRHPAGETFRYLANFSNAAEWDPGVLAGEQPDPDRIVVTGRLRAAAQRAVSSARTRCCRADDDSGAQGSHGNRRS